MKIMTVVGCVALAAAAVLALIARLPGPPWVWPAMLVQDAAPFVHLAMIVTVLVVLIAALRLLLGLAMKMSRRSKVLLVCAVLAAALGVFGAIWQWLGVYEAASATHTSRLDILAPGLAEGALALAIGVLLAAGMLAVNRWLTGRRRPAAL